MSVNTAPSSISSASPAPPQPAVPAADPPQAAFTATLEATLQAAAAPAKTAPTTSISDARVVKKAEADNQAQAPQPNILTSLAALILPAAPQAALPEIVAPAAGDFASSTGEASSVAAPPVGAPLSNPEQQNVAVSHQTFPVTIQAAASTAGQAPDVPSSDGSSTPLPAQPAGVQAPADAAQVQSVQAPALPFQPQAGVFDAPDLLPSSGPSSDAPAPIAAAQLAPAAKASAPATTPSLSTQPAGQVVQRPAAVAEIGSPEPPQPTISYSKPSSPAQSVKPQAAPAAATSGPTTQGGPVTAPGQPSPVLSQILTQLSSAPAIDSAPVVAPIPTKAAAASSSALSGASSAPANAAASPTSDAQIQPAPAQADAEKVAVLSGANGGTPQHGNPSAPPSLRETAPAAGTPASPVPFSISSVSTDAVSPAASKEPGLPAPAPVPESLPLQSAHLLQSAGTTELRLGLHSEEFGSVSIATSAASGVLQASIALDHGGLGHALAAHLPALEDKLGLQARIEVRDPGASVSGQGSSQSSPQSGRQSFTGRSATASLPFSTEPASAAGSPLPTSTTRLSVLA